MRDKPEEELTFSKPAGMPENQSAPENPDKEKPVPPNGAAGSGTDPVIPAGAAAHKNGEQPPFSVKEQFADLNAIPGKMDRKTARKPKVPMPGVTTDDPSAPAAKSIRRENDLQDFFRNLDIMKIMRGIYRRFWIALLCAFGLMLLTLPLARRIQGGISYSAEARLIYTDPSQKQIDAGEGSLFLLRPLSQDTLLDMMGSPENIRTLEEFTGFSPLEDRISFDSQSKSDIITVEISGMPDEQTASEAVNKLAEIIINGNADYYRTIAQKAYDHYHMQLEQTEKDLAEAVQAVEEFQRKNQMLELNTQYENYFSARSAAEERLSIAKVAHEGLIVRIKNYEKMIAELPDEVLNEAQEDNPLKRRISNAEAALLQARIQFAPDNPKIQRQEREIEELRKMLQSGNFDETRERTYIPNPMKGELEGELMKLRSEEEVAAQQLVALKKDMEALNARFEKLPGLEKDYARLLEKRTTLDAKAKILNASEESAKLTLASDLSDFRLLSPATVLEPTGASIIGKIVPVAGFVFGFFGGLAVILLIELLDAKIRTIHQLERAYDAPCLASVIDIPNLEQHDVYDLLLPSIREISDRLNVLLRGQKARAFGFLSALDSEGKSTLSFSLARYYASLGINVLFVSFDTKSNPCLPEPSDTAWPQMGIEDYLQDQAELNDMLLSVEGVSVIRVNRMQSNLLDQTKGSAMPRLWDLLRSSYDLIITEIPSVLDHPISGTVASFQDELIFVLASPVSDRKLADAALEFLEDRGMAPRALIFNRVNPYYLEDVRQQRIIRDLADQPGPAAGLFNRLRKPNGDQTPDFIDEPSLPPEDEDVTADPFRPDEEPQTGNTEEDLAPERKSDDLTALGYDQIFDDTVPEEDEEERKENPAEEDSAFEEMTEEEELSFIQWMQDAQNQNTTSEETTDDDEQK